MDTTIFLNLFSWAQGVTTGVTGNLAYDGLKKLVLPFVQRFKKYFSSEEQTEQYFQCLCSEKANNLENPYRDAEELYEKITSSTIKEKLRDELLNEIKVWMNENRELIINIRTHQKDNTFLQRIGSQRAKQIINIHGTANINEIK